MKILHNVILTDQLDVVTEIATRHETEPKIDFRRECMGDSLSLSDFVLFLSVLCSLSFI